MNANTIDQALQAAAEFEGALLAWASDSGSMDVGLAMQAAGQQIRPGAIEAQQRELDRDRERLQDAARALRQALDALGMG